MEEQLRDVVTEIGAEAAGEPGAPGADHSPVQA
jgi:hypothetical protein